MPHKFHYAIELEARGIRRAGRFPIGFSDFSDIHQLPGLAYFDKTEYIVKGSGRGGQQQRARIGGANDAC